MAAFSSRVRLRGDSCLGRLGGLGVFFSTSVGSGLGF